MIDKIRGIAISGRCYSPKTKLTFFQKPSDRICVVFGKNGSGKSTIAESFSLLERPGAGDLSAQLLDEGGKGFDPTASGKIFVFNEKYVDDNVKIDDDALGTIILLGGQIDIQGDIDKYEKLRSQAAAQVALWEQELEKYENGKNVLSPLYHFERIRARLKQKSGWAEVDSRIKGNRRNTSVTDETVLEIGKISPRDTLEDLQAQFRDLWDTLSKTSDSSLSFPHAVGGVTLAPGFEAALRQLLEKQIQEPVLSQREQEILAVIQGGRQELVEASRESFSAGAEVCPYCFRSVDEGYKNALLESINRVLNKDVDQHTAALSAVAFPDFGEDVSGFGALDPELVSRIALQQAKCAETVQTMRRAIQEKLSNVYAPVTLQELELAAEVDALNALLAELEDKRQAFNDAVSQKAKLKERLIFINKQIAHRQVEDSYKEYIKQSRSKKNCEKELQKHREEETRLAAHLGSLYRKKADAGLAINNINNALDYVFFAKGRLSIELRSNKYYLKSNGQYVRPRSVSLAERNIIALCYFFTQIVANQDVRKLYREKEMIVIDDPISSVDFENRVGITSFIRYQMDRILQGNPSSKILVLSHDLTTVFDMQKAAKEVCDKTKGRGKASDLTFCTLELSERSLKPFSNKRSEYNELLQTVYRYANGEFPGDLPIIGNVMRRVLEAFASFNYRKGIGDVSCDPNVLAALGDHSVYYENLMYRLVLHGESHYEEQVYSLHDDANFYSFVSDTEKKRTARDILCFIYFLNPHHIDAYFRHTPKALPTIQKWAESIPVNASFEVKRLPLRRVWLYDTRISAGIGNTPGEGDSHEEYETANQECDFALRISGDSMEPQIPDGSVVLVKKRDSVPVGRIGAFLYNGQLLCKKLTQDSGGHYLVSLNSAYPPLRITEEDTLHTYGEVIETVAP